MPKKCCVKGCKTNYASEKAKGVKKVSVFRFPSAKKEQDARKKWIQAIQDHMNNNSDLHVTENSVVCENIGLLAIQNVTKMVMKDQLNHHQSLVL